MFKNLSMWMFDKSPDGEQAQRDTKYLRTVMYDREVAENLIVDNEPANPGPGQLKYSGLLPVDELILESSLEGANRFLPLTQVIRERVLDNGAIKFEVNERVKHIFTMEGRRCGRKELQSIKDEVIESMLKDAPIREKRVFGIVTSMGKILVGATGKAAEDYIAYIKSLFGEGHIRTWPADIGSWSPHLEIEEFDDGGDFLLVTDFARNRIEWFDQEYADEQVFTATGTFQFSQGTEKFAVAGAKKETVDQLMDRVARSYVDFIELNHEHAVFKLTANLELKSIKLQDLEYTPENDEETGLSAAYYRFYMSFFLGLFDTIVREVAKVGQENSDAN